MHSLWRSRDHPLLPYRHPVFGGSPPFCTLLAHIRALVPIGYTPSLSIFQSSLEALAITPPDTWSSMDVVAWFHHRLSAFFSLLDAPPSWTRHPRRTAPDVPRALSDAPPPSCRRSVALHYRRRPAVARISTIAHLCAPLSRTTYAGRDSLRVFLLFTLPHWHHCRRADSRRHPDCFRHLIVACSRCSVVLNDATGRKHRLRSSARMDIHPRDSET